MQYTILHNTFLLHYERLNPKPSNAKQIQAQLFQNAVRIKLTKPVLKAVMLPESGTPEIDLKKVTSNLKNHNFMSHQSQTIS